MRRFVSSALLIIAAGMAGGLDGQTTSVVPLCSGLTIVTAIHWPQGDSETIKRVESVTPEGVRFRYTGYFLDPRAGYTAESLKLKPPPLMPYYVYRTLSAADIESSGRYLQQFAPSPAIPEVVKNTTSLGISRRVFRELKQGKRVPFTIFRTIPPAESIKTDGNEYQLPGELWMVDQKPASIAVLVNGRPMSLPAIYAHGKFVRDEGDFYFLDDETNPITLKFTVGTSAQPTRDNLLVVKINYDCPSEASSGGEGRMIETQLADTGNADVYSIYFAFGSDSITDESEPTLKIIAEVLRRHPDWKLQVNGHTDPLGGDEYNLDLSRRRADAVKDALVKRYQVDANRLTTQGYGKSRPKDTNDTIEGRARNRRVELHRTH
jgi:outer membrane protein OmpA-like peptidoglycan-associated protein